MIRSDLKFVILVLSLILPQSYSLLKDLVDSKFHNLDITKLCHQNLKTFKNGLYSKEIWAWKMYDASGRISYGFVWGNNMYVGSELQCDLLNHPFEDKTIADSNPSHLKSLTEIGTPFPVKYKAIFVKHNSKLQIDVPLFSSNVLNIGLCLPKSCTIRDASILVDHVLHSDVVLEKSLIGNDTKVLRSSDLTMRKDFYKHPVVMILMILATMMLANVVIGTVCHDKGKKTKSRKISLESIHSCFALQNNMETFFSMESKRNSVDVINGIKTFTSILVSGIHVFAFFHNIMSNDKIWAVIFLRAEIHRFTPFEFTIDILLVIGGLVMSKSFFDKIKEIGRISEKSAISIFVKCLKNRFLRIAPLYYFTFILNYVIVMYLNDTSPYYNITNDEVKCNKNWIRSLLFVENLFQSNINFGMRWSWYLMVDIQCYIITLIIMIIFIKNLRLGIYFLGLMLTLPALITSYYAYTLPINLNFINMLHRTAYFYSTPLCRLGEYLIGAIGGWILAQSDRKQEISKFSIRFALILIGIPFLQRFYHEASKFGSINYFVIGKMTYAAGVVWLIIAFQNGKGGSFNNFFSLNIFKIFNRLGLAVYLINPIIITVISMKSSGPLSADFYIIVSLAIASVILTYVFSFIMYILVELPFTNVVQLIFK